MKKIFIICAIGWLPLVAQAAQNPIKMTTFFPAPYAAFSRLNALNRGNGGFNMETGLVVGLSSSSECKLSLGCEEVSSNPLDSFQTVVSSGDLYLEGKNEELVIESTTGGGITVGNSSQPYGEKRLQFKQNAHIGSFQNLISANFGTANIQTLKIGNMAFPSCKAASGASGQGKMQWQELTLQVDGQSANSRKGYFLTCGAGTPCDTNCYKWVYKADGPRPESACSAWCSSFEPLDGRECSEGAAPQSGSCCEDNTLHPDGTYDLFYFTLTCEKACDCGGSGGSIGVVPGGGSADN